MSDLRGGTKKGISLIAGIALPPRGGRQDISLRNIAAIAAVEELMDQPGVEWQLSFEQKCDAASLATFGITEATTRPAEPHPDDFTTGPGTSRYSFGDQDFNSYNQALDVWYNWKEVIEEHEVVLREQGAEAFWESRRVIITDRAGFKLRCFHRFSRQLYAAYYGLLPGAKITVDGSGKRAAQSIEEWGAALEAEARKFRPSRR